MKENHVFVLSLNMKKRTPEEIAREAAMEIGKITDKLIEQQNERRKEKL